MNEMTIGNSIFRRIILGTSNFSTSLDYENAEAIMSAYIDAGGIAIDTARVYGAIGGTELGGAERYVGRFLKENGIRDKVVLMTKGGFPHLDDYSKSRLNYNDIYDDLSQSLEALKTDYIDVYFLHRDNLNQPAEEIIEILAPMVKNKTVRHLGCSNWTAERIAAANRYAYRNHLPCFVASQIHWSLAQTTPTKWGDETLVCMNDTEYNFYELTQMPIIAYAAHGKGYFAKGVHGIENISSKAKTRFDSAQNRERLNRVRILSEEQGITAASCAISYITSNSLNAAALIGVSSVSQLKENMKSVSFDRKTLDYLAYGK